LMDNSSKPGKSLVLFSFFIFFYVLRIFLLSTDLLNEVRNPRILRISLISCHYPWFSSGASELRKRITFIRTFPYLSVSSASPSEQLPSTSSLNVSDRQIQKCHP
jgi:hypothetical protein